MALFPDGSTYTSRLEASAASKEQVSASPREKQLQEERDAAVARARELEAKLQNGLKLAFVPTAQLSGREAQLEQQVQGLQQQVTDLKKQVM